MRCRLVVRPALPLQWIIREINGWFVFEVEHARWKYPRVVRKLCASDSVISATCAPIADHLIGRLLVRRFGRTGALWRGVIERAI